MHRNDRVKANLGSMPLFAILLVDSSHTYCSLCGGEALPDQITHLTNPATRLTPYANPAGCGARFVAIGALNRYDGVEEAMHRMRPDLSIVEITDAEANRLQLS